MKRLWVSVLLLVLLSACGTNEPPYTDNGNPGQIKAVVFFDDNKNGIMDSGEVGAPLHRLALADRVGCTSSTGTLNFLPTGEDGVLIFSDLEPGSYCVGIDNGYAMTTKVNVDAFVSSDEITTVMFGVVREE